MMTTRISSKKDRRMLVLFLFAFLLLAFDLAGFYGIGDLFFYGNDMEQKSFATMESISGAAGQGGRELSPQLAFFLCQPMSINRCSREDLALLPGIGEQLADRIFSFRRRHGFFHNLYDVEKVRGVGKKLGLRIRPMIYFAEP